MHRISVLALVVGFLTCACFFGGISRDRAIELALSGGGREVIWAEAGPLGQFVNRRTLPEERRDRQVWAVLVKGAFPASCPFRPTGLKCPADATQQLVVLDFRTGDFIFSESR